MKPARKKTPSVAQAARHVNILDQTKRLLGEIGADRMTMRDLAAASGVAPGTLYNRFGGKDQIISMAVLDHFGNVVSSRLEDYRGAKTPLDKLLLGIDLIANNCVEGPAFASALMNAYFKTSARQRMHDSLFRALYETWLPIVAEMQQRNLLRPWVLAPALCVEMCDREFGTVMKWVQVDIPFVDLRDRSTFSVLAILLGASRGRQATRIEGQLEQILGRIGKTYVQIP